MERTGLVLVLVVGILGTSASGFEIPGRHLVSQIIDKASDFVAKQKQDDSSLSLPEHAVPLEDLGISFLCRRDGLYAYPDDCTMGISCLGGEALAFTCTDIFHFNNVTKECDNFCSARCDPGLACQCGWETCDTSEFPSEETATGELTKNLKATTRRCVEDGLFPFHQHCSLYIECKNTRIIFRKCPSGLQFSRKTKRCEEPEDARCKRKMSSEFPSEETATDELTENQKATKQRYRCVEDGLFPYAWDCNQYIQCKNTRIIFKKCPSGLHFSTKTRRCEEPEDAQCNLKMSWTKMPSSVDNESDDVDSSPMSFFRSSCNQDGLFAHPDNCNMYYECFHGRRVFHTCRPGLHFNKKTKTCDTPCKAKCDPNIYCPRQRPESKTTEKSKTESFASSNMMESSKKIYKLRVTFVCSEDGLFPHRSDCSKYINCSDGYAYEMSCPPSRHFNNDTRECETLCSAKCDPNLMCNWRDSMLRIEEAYDDICNNTDETYYAWGPRNCEIYYKCEGSELNKFRCPNGQHFHKKQATCKEPCNAYCQRSLAEECGWPTVLVHDEIIDSDNASFSLNERTRDSYGRSSTFGRLCSRGGTYLEGNLMNCRTYFKCNDGDVVLEYCPEGQHFNQLKLRCEDPCDAHCNFTLIKPCGWRYRSEAENVQSTSLKQPVFDFQCPGNGLYANTACENFIQCTGGHAYLINCPYGQHFDPYTSRCTTPCEARCAPNYEDFCKDEEKIRAPKHFLGDFDCQTDGYHRNPLDCRSFIQCFKGDAYVISCPIDLHYSPTLEICMSPCEAKCAPNYEEYCRAEDWSRKKLLQSQGIPAKQPYPLVSEFICANDGVYPNPEDCGRYIECVLGESFDKYCPEGLHFREETQTCESPCKARCDSSLAQLCGWNEIWAANENTRKFIFDHKLFAASDSPALMYHFTCMKDGLYKNPQNCSTFIQCSDGHSYLMQCPAGLHFNEHLKVCDYPCAAHCDDNLACECEWETCDETPEDNCDENEQYLECGTACPPTCDNRKPEVCTDQCVSSCFCKNGFIREKAGGKCIPVSECPSVSCGPNEVHAECVNACNSCNLRNVTCNFLICNEGCDCLPGYTRNDKRICIPENECPPVPGEGDCNAAVDAGPCNGRFHRYAYDPRFGRCGYFVYGGCGGNSNNFKTIQECEEKCGNKLLRSEEVDCGAEPETGPCKARLPRYAYDPMSGRCRGFIYGGCKGNSNNFITMEECENKCRNKLLGGFRCPEENGMFGHYPDCQSYYHCKRGIPTLKRCPRGTAFDHKKSKCVTEYEATCVYECRNKNAVYPFEEDCHKYIDCVNGISKLEKCPPGKAFDPKESDCVDEKQVETCFWEE